MNKMKNSIGFKLYSVSILFSVIGIATIVVFGYYFIKPSYDKLEKHKSEMALEVIRKAYKSEISHMNLMCLDWGTWDGMYDFVQNPDSEFIESNLTLRSFKKTNCDLVYIYGENGNRIYGACYDYDNNSEYDLDQLSGSKNFVPGVSIPENYDYKTVLYALKMVKEGFYIATVTRPIMPSSGDERLANGTMVFGIILNENLYYRLKEDVGLDYNVISNLTEHDLQGYSNLSKTTNPFTGSAEYKYVNQGDSSFVQTLVVDYDGNPALILSHKIDNEITSLGRKSFHYNFVLLTVILMVLCGIGWLSIRHVIMRPLIKLVREIEYIQRTYDLTITESLNRNDELGYLARQFNDLLQDIKVKTSQLEAMATTDSMTGILNHKTVLDKLELEMSRSKRYGNSLSAAVLDIDYFKNINDKYGHQAGDEVIKGIVDVIKGEIRDSDYFGRYGGDEFLLVFIDQDINHASQAMERIYQSVAAIKWQYAGMNVTLSSGVAELSNDINVLTELIERADNNLYKAKDRGRNNYACDKDKQTIV